MATTEIQSPPLPQAFPATMIQPPAAPTQPAVPPPLVYVPAPAAVAPPTVEPESNVQKAPLELRVYSHSFLFYWWPVWAVGFLMAALTYFQGEQNQIGAGWDRIHASSNLGIIFFLTLFLVILITNVSVRGLASGMVILSVILATVLLAYFDLWNDVLHLLGNLKIHLNLGAYLSFSILMFVVWGLTVFVFDRMTYWRIKPGQITYEFVFGSGSKSYDTDGMVLEKHRDDLFRHWLLGLGSGDLQIQTTGAHHDRIDVPNVLFIGSKVEVIQRMIAIKPEEFGRATIK